MIQSNLTIWFFLFFQCCVAAQIKKERVEITSMGKRVAIKGTWLTKMICAICENEAYQNQVSFSKGIKKHVCVYMYKHV